MASTPTRVALIGCGNIANPYARNLATYPDIELAGATDLDVERAKALTDAHGGKPYASLDALLADPTIAIVVNLTIHHAHYAITKRCLEAGKHVFSEKPIALTPAEAHELVQLADVKGLRLGSAPFSWMGEAQQAAWKFIRDGKLGKVRLVFAEVNHGRIEAWHPNPGPFYAVGPWFDVGVYPLTLLTTFFGPVQWIQTVGDVLYPERITKEGKAFSVESPDCMLATLKLADGQLVRLTCNFYVKTTRQAGIEFHGDDGSLHLGSWLAFHADVSYGAFGQPLDLIAPASEPYTGTEWGRGVRDLAEAIRMDRPHRATGAQAAHVVDVLAAGMQSMAQGKRIKIESSFPMPLPLS